MDAYSLYLVAFWALAALFATVYAAGEMVLTRVIG